MLRGTIESGTGFFANARGRLTVNIEGRNLPASIDHCAFKGTITGDVE